MKQKTNITTEDLAKIMKSGFEESAKTTKEAIDDLARATKNGFDESAKTTKENIDNLAKTTKRGFEESAKTTKVVVKEIVKEAVDELAIMTKKGFDEVDKKFELARKDLQATEGRLTNVIKSEKQKRIDFNVKIIEILGRNGLLEKNEADYLELLT